MANPYPDENSDLDSDQESILDIDKNIAKGIDQSFSTEIF